MDTVTASAVIGACSALAGVCLSQAFSLLQSFFERKNRQRALLRDKLEEVAQNLLQTARWVDVWFHQALVQDAKRPKSSVQPLGSSEEARRVYVLSLLYFPRLRLESQRVMAALNILHYGISETEVDNEKLVRAGQDFAAAKVALEKLITEEAETLT